ncbi:hypothetical protein EU527_17045 [Candidatus Thorarchaeota archaeon]|nr:MAG: hypothetical protein EU527_17045 [Candidatus Thorarchaeota archaeon]
MKATLSLDFQSPEDAKRILSAIIPDNTPLPQGLELECRAEGTRLLLSIYCERGLSSLSSTIEDILSAVDLAIRTLESLDAQN